MQKFFLILLSATYLFTSHIKATGNLGFVSKEIVSKTIEEFPSVFPNWSDIDMANIERYRQSYVKLIEQSPDEIMPSANTFYGMFIDKPFDELIPFAKDALNYLEKKVIPLQPKAECLKTEIEDHIKSNAVTPLWLMVMNLRMQASVSIPYTQNELKLFGDMAPVLLEALFKNLNLNQVAENEQDLHNLFKQYLNEESLEHLSFKTQNPLQELLKNLSLRLPPAFLYPFYNYSQISPAKIIWAYLNNIFPISLSTKTNHHTHGTSLSLLIYTFHDLEHALGFYGPENY